MAELASNIRYALRALQRAPGFALVAVLTLALGIGANSAIFSVLNAVVLRPLAYSEPDRLVRVASQFPSLGFDKFWISPPEYFELQERASSFESLGGYRTGTVSVGGGDTPLRATSATATHELFETLGVAAALGRAFTAEEDQPGAAGAVTLSHELWQSAFAGDPGIVGRMIEVNGAPSRVTGVMPPGFDVADAGVQLWVPAALDRANRENRGSHFLDVIGRLRPGTKVDQARAELSTLVAQWSDANPGTHTPGPDNHPIYMLPLQEDLVGNVRPALLLLLGAVGFVLLIACANVANLLLARAESRQREIAVRAALGAGRMRLIRQFLTEGVILSLIGGAVGLFLGWAGVRLLIATNPNGIPRAVEIGIDTNVLLFTLAVSVATGLLFGLAPAMHLSKRTVTGALRDSSRTTASGARLQVRRLLVITETALAVILVVGSGLMLRSFAELQRVDPGFEPDGLLTFQLYLPPATYAEPGSQIAFYDLLLSRLESLPGVTSVAAMSGMPPRRDVNANDTQFENVEQSPDGPAHNVDYYQNVTTDYFTTMQIPLASGRAFEYSDIGGTAPVVLINERLARVFYPDTDPIGRRIRPCCGDDVPWLTVVGVVSDVKQGGMDEETGTELYFLYAQVGTLGFVPRTMNVVIRTKMEPMTLAASVRTAVREADASLPIANLATMDDVLHESIARPRFIMLLLGIFAAVALVLAAVGTYGVMSYSVAQRRQEIGIRMALGAQGGAVQRMVLFQGFSVALLGLALGIAGALAVTRLLSTLLFNVGTTDATAFVAGPAVLGLVALLACWIPAQRATRVDPATVLKQD